jgi:PAS domain S-box-containing protein
MARVNKASTTRAKSGAKIKQVVAALEESQEKLRKMFESVTDGISVVDLNGIIAEVNQRMVEMHGFKSRDELLGRNALELVAPRDHERIAANMRRAVKQGTVRGVEYTLLKANGSEFPGELSTSILKDASGNWIGHITIVRDVTERKRMEEALKAAQEQLIRSEKLAAIGQLASGVGHELRNPLGAIKTAVHYVRRKIAGSELSAAEPRVVEFLGLIDEEVDSANKVITDLLSFSRVAKPTVSLVKVGSIIRDALNHVTIPGNVEVVTDVDPGLPMVMVDGGQIQQVFVNVILNAVEAMPEGGRLEIRARGKDDFVAVEFTDIGGGIPESVVGKIFDPLFTTKPKGIGLGLAMSKSIMERHGGDIGVKSKEGEGTIFILSLPTRVV